jgi:hypothetical protein
MRPGSALWRRWHKEGNLLFLKKKKQKDFWSWWRVQRRASPRHRWAMTCLSCARNKTLLASISEKEASAPFETEKADIHPVAVSPPANRPAQSNPDNKLTKPDSSLTVIAADHRVSSQNA